jgi:hypothetical protein
MKFYAESPSHKNKKFFLGSFDFAGIYLHVFNYEIYFLLSVFLSTFLSISWNISDMIFLQN